MNDIYRNYIADTLFYNTRGRMLVSKYSDILKPVVEERSADEIAEYVITKLGLTQE